MLYDAALRVGIRDDDAVNYLARIRAAASRHPNDPFARRTLAHAELLHGDRSAALRQLEALQAASPNDAELMYLRGRLHLAAAEEDAGDEAELQQAKRWFGQAHRADRNHFQTLYRFAMAQRQGSGSTSENTANVLLLAQQLAPQVVEIRMNAASLLLARNDLSGAEALLRPVMSDPHNRELAGAARRLLERARGGQPGAEAGATGGQPTR
jgi:Flp pilus assembly protein TadD